MTEEETFTADELYQAAKVYVDRYAGAGKSQAEQGDLPNLEKDTFTRPSFMAEHGISRVTATRAINDMLADGVVKRDMVLLYPPGGWGGEPQRVKGYRYIEKEEPDQVVGL